MTLHLVPSNHGLPEGVTPSQLPSTNSAMRMAAGPHARTARLARAAQITALGANIEGTPSEFTPDEIALFTHEAKQSLDPRAQRPGERDLAYKLRMIRRDNETLDPKQQAALDLVAHLGMLAEQFTTQASEAAVEAANAPIHKAS